MRVLFLSHSYPRDIADPVGSFILRLAVSLRERGVDVRVLVPSAPGLSRSEVIEGVRVDRFRYALTDQETLAYSGTMREQVRTTWSGRLAMLGMLAAGAAAATRLARAHRAEVLHAHWWFPSGVIAIPATLAGPLLVTTLHGSDVRSVRSRVSRRLFGLVVARSSVLTAVSTWLADQARALAPVGAARAVVAPMPVHGDLFTPGPWPRAPRLLFVGKLNEQKGFGAFLRALRAQRMSVAADVVGGVGSDLDEGRAAADALGVGSRIRWYGLLPQSALAERYREATALVMPALEEGLGLTAVEAMLSSTPVIAYDSGGLRDSVIDGRTGRLVAPGDDAALATAMDDLAGDQATSERLGREGRRFALERFAPARVAATYEDLYRKALDERSR